MTASWTPPDFAAARQRPIIELVEGGPAAEVVLTQAQVDSLSASGLVLPTPTLRPGLWAVVAGRYVGAARVAGVDVWIRPKLPIRRLLLLLGYAYDLKAWRDETVEVAEDTDLLPAVATAFARQAERAVEQGLLQGYRVTEESAPVLRGRIRTDEQLRRRFGLPVPLEIRYDDYTVDIPENRILRTASERLLRMPRLPGPSRQSLLRLVRSMADVQPLPRGSQLPPWQATRLNSRYQPALRLGELVLKGGSIEHERGRVAVDGFMLDMAVVFEQFVTVALREALAPEGGRVLGQPRYHLDEERRITLKPDVVWQWPDGRPRAVVDAKYKAEKPSGYPNADVYQMLAYCTRLHLSRGHLLYAEGAAEPGYHRVVGSAVTVVQNALPLDADPVTLLQRVAQVASELGQAREG